MANIKKFLKITLIFAFVASTVGCAKKADKVSNSVVEGASEITATNSASDESDLLISAEDNNDDVTGRELFKKFLANEEPVVFDLDNFVWNVPYSFDYGKENKRDYLFSEIIQRLMAEADLDEDNSVNINYAYIYPLEKEAEQLLISITKTDSLGWIDYILAIGNVDGKLLLMYENESCFRYEVHINKFGYIDECQYPGYCPPTDEYKILTEDGCKLIYGKTFECGYIIKPTQLQSFSDDGGYIWNYWFEDEYFCSYSFVNEEGKPDYIGLEEKLYGKNSPYRKAFEDAGISFYEMSEIEDIISKREEELGITDEIKEADVPEWIEIKDISGLI